eukprot:14233180-Alexandrium_andersonii.AAC.1
MERPRRLTCRSGLRRPWISCRRGRQRESAKGSSEDKRRRPVAVLRASSSGARAGSSRLPPNARSGRACAAAT